MRPPVPPLIEGTKTEVVYYKPEEDQDIPKHRSTRWLYYRAQIILGVLTFAILIFYAIQWLEYRSTRKLENRAYVGSKEASILPDPNPAFNDIFVTVINTGKTPGLNGSIVAQLEARERRRQKTP
jgi:hypothetical protein